MDCSTNNNCQLDEEVSTMALTKRTVTKTSADEAEEDQEETTKAISIQADTDQLLKFLPEDVWYQLTNRMRDIDVQNLSNSSLFFRNLLFSKRIFFLYKPVMTKILPKLPKLDRSSLLLSNRLVCQKYSQKTCALTSRKWNKHDKTPTSSITYPTYSFEKSRKIEKFLNFFNRTHSSETNPVLGRSIVLDFSRQRVALNQDEFFAKCFQLLDKYGNHVTNCEIVYKIMTLQTPTNLQNLLGLLSNLKYLKISYNPSASQDVNMAYRVGQGTFSNIPTLPKLKFLKLKKLPWGLFAPLLLKNCSTIWVLEIKRPLPYFNFDYSLESILPVLKSIKFLKLDIFHENDIEFSSHNFGRSPKKLRLKKLHLEITKNCGVSLYQVFTQIESNFPKTLEHFCLNIPQFQVNSLEGRKFLCDSKHYRLNLSKVKKLELIINSYDISLNFIVGLSQSLEELAITLTVSADLMRNNSLLDMYPSEGKEIIDWIGYEDNMLRSNVWYVFPNLNRLVMTRIRPMMRFKTEYCRMDWLKSQQKIFKNSLEK